MSDLIANADSRHMQPLPWATDPWETGKCITLKSASGKTVCSFWGGDERDPRNLEWPTAAQMERHAIYVAWAANHFPALQAALENIHGQCGDAALKEAIEEILGEHYYEGVPAYVRR